MKVRGSKVLVTGATGGLGHAIARRLSTEGATLVLTGRRAGVLAALAGEVRADVIECDLSDRGAVADLAERCADVDILVNNAALPGAGDVMGLDVDDIDRALEVNLRAPIVLTRLIGAAMAERGSGHIVLMSSLAGKSGTPRTALYNAAKFGLRGFGQGVRHDLQDRGVGVSVIFPGFIRDAGMFADADVEPPRGVGTSTPEAVAAAVVSAVEHDRGEVDVAPLQMRLGATFSGVFPSFAHTITHRFGGDFAQRLTDQQRDRR